MSIWARVAALMDAKKVTAYKLSKATGISSGNITDWKNGKANPSYGALVKIAGYFNVPVEYLEGKIDDPQPADQNDLDELEWAMLDGFRDLSDDDKREMLAILNVKQQKKRS